MAKVSGGDKLKAALGGILNRSSNAAYVEIGFMADVTYPDGKSVAMVAAIQEFGAPKRGIPPRPFFRNMIAAKKDQWPKATADLLVANDYDATKTLKGVGENVARQLKQSLNNFTSPGLAKSTIARKTAKGAANPTQPLVDTGLMLRSINSIVK